MTKVVSDFLRSKAREYFASQPALLAFHATLWGLFVFVPPSATAQSIAEAQRQEASGNWANAAATWHALAEATPKDYRLWTSMGAALAHQGRLPEAVTAYGKAKALAPGDPQTNFNLGLAYFKMNRLPDAIAPLRVAAEVMPRQPQIHLLLGMSLYGAGRFGEAGDTLVRARKEGSPATAEFHQVLAQCYLRTKQTDLAKTELSELLKNDPDSASAHMMLGEAHDASGQADLAKEEFRAAIVADARLPDLHFGLGYLLWKDREYEQAEAELRKEIELDAKHTQALTYLGDVLLKRDAKDEAERDLEAARVLNNGLWLTHLDLGIIAADKRNWQKASDHFLKASALEPDRAEPHYRLAQAYKAQGQADKAAIELRKVSSMHKEQEDRLVEKISGPQTTPLN